jgi:hypothetical protein
MNNRLSGLIILVGIVIVASWGCGQNAASTVNARYDGLLITPEAVSVMVGETASFRINGVLARGVAGAATAPVTWEVLGGIGTIDSDGLFTATAEGTGTIEARAGALVGTAVVTVTPEDLGESYYPHANGYSWVMAGSDGSLNISTFEGITAVGPTYAQIMRTLIVSANNSCSTSEAYYMVNSSGVYLCGYPGNIYSPALLLFKFPLAVGNTWSVGNLYGLTIEATVISQESVTVPAGTFNSYKIYTVFASGTSFVASFNYWLGKNAGLVKTTSSISTVESVLRSKNF